eukprot:COSAG02_NODE_259_length_26776_cov_1723.750084_1_plen_31_part_10
MRHPLLWMHCKLRGSAIVCPLDDIALHNLFI